MLADIVKKNEKYIIVESQRLPDINLLKTLFVCFDQHFEKDLKTISYYKNLVQGRPQTLLLNS